MPIGLYPLPYRQVLNPRTVSWVHVENISRNALRSVRRTRVRRVDLLLRAFVVLVKKHASSLPRPNTIAVGATNFPYRAAHHFDPHAQCVLTKRVLLPRSWSWSPTQHELVALTGLPLDIQCMCALARTVNDSLNLVLCLACSGLLRPHRLTIQRKPMARTKEAL